MPDDKVRCAGRPTDGRGIELSTLRGCGSVPGSRPKHHGLISERQAEPSNTLPLWLRAPLIPAVVPSSPDPHRCRCRVPVRARRRVEE